MQVHAIGKRRKKGRARRANMREKVLQIRARLEHQGASQFAVNRVLDDHVENPNAVIEKDLKLLFGSFGRVLAREDRSVTLIRLRRQAIACGRRQDFFAARPKDRDILHQALPAHVEMLRDLDAGNGATVLSQPSDDLTAPPLGILRARPRAVSRRRADGLGPMLLSCHQSSLL